MQHAARMAALAGRIEATTLVTSLPNIRYLTGFTGSSAYLVARRDGSATFLTDGRYGEMAEPLVAALEGAELVVSTTGIWDALGAALRDHAPVAVEAGAVTWDFVRTLSERTGIDPIPTTGVVEALRRTKDADEVAALGAAASAGDVAFSDLGALVSAAPTERELGWALVDAMRRAGGEAAEWEPIVAAGAGASIPHYRAGSRPLGDALLLLDYGCVVDGYHSDMSRTVWIDGDPDPEMARVYRAVAESQEAGIAAAVPGAACGEVDEAARAVLRGYGYEEHFLHSTGHGVGLEIHEEPWVRRGNDDPLRIGDAITVEPGVYLPGVGGVRIEDMVLVGADGPQILTKSSREMQPR